MRLAIAGRRGFIGRSVADAAAARGWTTVALPPIRVAVTGEVHGSVTRWMRDNATTFEELVATLCGSSVLVNAGGLAAPMSNDIGALLGANVATSSILAHAAAAAEVPRFVYISSAAVQGNRTVLDESLEYQPIGPYGRSKVAGERALLDPLLSAPDERVVYRPTSVQGVDRGVTRTLVRLAALPVVPLCGSGGHPVPVALVENVAAAVMHLSQTATPPPVALHPWEGLTVRSMFEAFGTTRFLGVHPAAVRVLASSMDAAGRHSARVGAHAQRFRLVTVGQEQRATALGADGFQLPHGRTGYVEMAKRIRLGGEPVSRTRGVNTR